MQADSNLKVDGDRLWQSRMEMAKIGAAPNGGVNRLTLTDLDAKAAISSPNGARLRAAR